MSKKETILGIFAVSCIAACVPIGMAALEGGGGEGPTIARPVQDGDVSSAASSPTAPSAAILEWSASDPPAAPGLGGETLTRSPAASDPIGLAVHLLVDRYAEQIVGADLAREHGCTIELESRRNVIEHAITGHAAIGITSVPPSAQERRLGASDMILGDFVPVLIAARGNAVRVLTRSAAHALLAGKGDRYWPGTDLRVRVYGPFAGHRADMLAALLIPGDLLRIDRGFGANANDTDSHAATTELIESVASDPHAIGVSSEAELRGAETEVARIEIEGHRPRLTLYLVFRDPYEPSAARLLAFYRSPAGREFFERRLALR